MTAGEALRSRLRAAQDAGEEAVLELLGELEGVELAEAVMALSPAAASAPARWLHDDGGAGARWGRS